MVAVVVAGVVTACGRPVARLSVAPPAPVVARTGCGSFEIGRDGRVSTYRASWAPRWAPGAVSHPGPGVWVAHPHARLAVYRNGRLLWLSRIKHASDEVVVRGTSIAFTVYRHDRSGLPELWMAQVGGHEFRAGRHEELVGWTAGGLVTTHRGALRVRGPGGTVYRTLGRGHSALYEPRSDTVVFLSPRGDLIRTDGRRVWRIARGFGRNAWVERLDGDVLEVTTERREIFLHRDGSRLGISVRADDPAALLTWVIALPGVRGIAYVVRTGLRAGSTPGTNVVYIARPHARPRRLYAHPVPWLSCGEYASVSYARGRILFVDDEGPVAVLDPTGHAAPVDLTSALDRLQPHRVWRRQLNADWASKWR
ncbi:MAG TPA: hypothetical protein VE736_10060 [Gaiellaceae bacterium]|nr:hypothetical protein [Gaiellaceae bacterium]